MTLIPCASEKLFRPWDTDCGARKETTTPVMKEEPDRLVSSPASSSSGASSSDESEVSSLMSAGSPSYSAIQQAYSAHMMSAALGHHTLPSPFLPASLPAWMASPDAFRPHHHHIHSHHQQPHHLVHRTAEAPSMERFLASLESSPEALHPSRLAALGMGPNEIGELYQLAGFKPIHHFPSAVNSAAASHPSGKKQRPKRFRCPHCQVAFSNNGQLKGHVRSHTGKQTNRIANYYLIFPVDWHDWNIWKILKQKINLWLFDFFLRWTTIQMRRRIVRQDVYT